MPSGKYTDFEEGHVILLKSKMPPYDEGRYIPITCPHCKIVFVEIKEKDLKTNKSSRCLTHLRSCEAYKSKGGEVAPKKIPLTDEIAELKTQMAIMKQENSTMKYEMQGELKELQEKTSLYDSVLEAVMPSLVLPLTAPMENAKITLREAAIKDVAPWPLALPAPVDAISKEIHTAMIEHKDALIERQDALIAVEKAHKEEIAKMYKEQLDAKDSELSQTKKQMDKLQKERDVLKARFDDALNRHTHKRSNDMEAARAAAVACEREFAQKESALKRARQS